MPTEAQRRASRKYDAEKMESVKFRVVKGKREGVKALAEAYGMSVNETLNHLVDAAMEDKHIKWKPAE